MSTNKVIYFDEMFDSPPSQYMQADLSNHDNTSTNAKKLENGYSGSLQSAGKSDEDDKDSLLSENDMTKNNELLAEQENDDSNETNELEDRNGLEQENNLGQNIDADDDTSSSSSLCTERLLSLDPMYIRLTKFLYTPDNKRNITQVLEGIEKKLDILITLLTKQISN